MIVNSIESNHNRRKYLHLSGTFLLFFANVAVAEVTQASTVALEKSDSQEVSTAQGITTILKKVSFQNQSVLARDEASVDTTEPRARDKKDETDDRINSHGDTVKDTKKADTTISHNIRDSTEIERSSVPDGNRKPRYGEIGDGISGKSTGAKVFSEDHLRYSRTNELTTATVTALNDTKEDNKQNFGNSTLQESSNYDKISDITIVPSMKDKAAIVDERSTTDIMKNSEHKHKEITLMNHTLTQESSSDYRDKKNVSVNGKEAVNTKSFGDDLTTTLRSISENNVKIDERKDKTTKSDHKETVFDLKKDKNTSPSDLEFTKDREYESEDRKLKDRNTELTSLRNASSSKKSLKSTQRHSSTIASEVPDLKKIDEKEHEEEEEEGTVSLANDTYVNHFYRTSTEKDLTGGSPRNRSSDTDLNGTGVTRRKDDPKGEVEIVKNVTHQPILKIVATTNDTPRNESHHNELSNRLKSLYTTKKEQASGTQEYEEDQRIEKLPATSTNATTETAADSTEKRKSIMGKAESQKLFETTTPSIRSNSEEQIHSSTIGSVSHPTPHGRTIELSEINEFSHVEVKPVTVRKEMSGIARNQRRNLSEAIDQRPYPYLKTSREFDYHPVTETSLRLKKNRGNVDVSEEESSAYENTIGRGEETEKKFVITESSVVLENSIHQRKQKPDEKSVNGSTSSTTEGHSASPVTVILLTSLGDNNSSTSETFQAKSDGATGVVVEESKSQRSNENGITGIKREEKVIIASRNEGYDVTGNGITEASLTVEATESPILHSTVLMSNVSKIYPPNTDFQNEPEEAMMIRSTLIVTESTIVDKDTSIVQTNKSTTSMVSSMKNNTIASEIMTIDNSTERNTKEQSASHTNTIVQPSSATLNPNETSSSISTATTVEYEFITLTEARMSSGNNTTERNTTTEVMRILGEKTTPQDDDLFVKNINTTENEITTMKSEDITDVLSTTTIDTTSMIDQIMENETEVKKSTPLVHSTVAEQMDRTEFTRNDFTMNPIDYGSSSSSSIDIDTGMAVGTEDSTEAKDQESFVDVNVTEILVPGVTESPPYSDNTTPRATMDVTMNPSIPFTTTSTVEPKIIWNTSDLPEEEPTDSITTLSSDEITLLVKIVIEGTLHEVCPRLQELRKVLADALTTSMDK